MKRRKGFTLVEVILTIALVGMVILGGTNLITFAIRGHKMTMNEFDVQSNIRIASQRLNTVIRDSSAVFVLHRDNPNNLTAEWNYVMLSPGKDKLISYVWNSTINDHVVKDLFPSMGGVTLDIEFIKNNVMDANRLLKFNLQVDGLGESRTIASEIESKNSLQVVDRSYLQKGNTLAYRTDSRLDEVSNSQAVVGMVLDKSGSMADRMDGSSYVYDNNSNSFYHSRIKLMRQEAIRLVEGLSDYPNVYVSVNPFDSNANGSKDMLNVKQNLDTSPGLRSIINGLRAGGGTNTGDGIRRAYHKIKEFNELPGNTTKTNKNFMIILVDGVTTFGSCNQVYYNIIDNGSYVGLTGTDSSNREYNYMGRVGYDYRYIHYDPTKTNFVDGNNGLSSSSRFPYLNNSSYIRPAGNGIFLDPIGKEYVDYIGNYVRTYKSGTNEAIKVYVIGFSAVTDDYGSLEDIAKATTGETVYYQAGSAEALESIFNAIQKDISDALWHIGGPN